MKRSHRILEFVRESSAHLAQTLKVSFQCDLLAQFRNFRDVCQQAERAARAAFDKLYGRYGRAKSPLASFAGCGNDLFAAINLAGSQTALDHLHKRRGVLE